MLDSRTNRLGVPSNAEVEFTACAIGGRCRECDEGHMEHMREHVIVMIMLGMMQLMTEISILPTRAEMRLGYMKTQKRLQAATRTADASVVVVDGCGRQVR